MTQRMKNKTVIVTGAGRGIGEAIVVKAAVVCLTETLAVELAEVGGRSPSSPWTPAW